MEGVEQIRNLVFEGLYDLHDVSYLLLDVPYYTNVGDLLIYKGTKCFLERNNCKCLADYSIETYQRKEIGKDVVILFQGGGNFGDIWRRHTEFVLAVLKDYPDNKVVILPQTVFYHDEKILGEDAAIMNAHGNLVICGRDTRSLSLLKNNFQSCDVRLVPDMAFCIDENCLKKYQNCHKKELLFFKRRDVEYAQYDFDIYQQGYSDIEEHEWPSMEKKYLSIKILDKLIYYQKMNPENSLFRGLLDFYAKRFFIPLIIRQGIRFLSQYKTIHSTRLHGAILSVLLNRQLLFFDNTYEKNSNFYYTWLKDISNVEFVDKNE